MLLLTNDEKNITKNHTANDFISSLNALIHVVHQHEKKLFNFLGKRKWIELEVDCNESGEGKMVGVKRCFKITNRSVERFFGRKLSKIVGLKCKVIYNGYL
jgi:hypothetical protein